MKKSKLTALSVLVALLVTFCSYVAYKHISWVNSVDGKEFRGTIVNLSSTMSSGKYPRSEEYVLVAWEDGSRSYFQVAPVHDLIKGGTWVTKVDQGYLSGCNYCDGSIPESAMGSKWVAFWWIFIRATFMVTPLAILWIWIGIKHFGI